MKLISRNKKYLEGYKDYCQEFYDNNIITFKPANPDIVNLEWFENSLDWYTRKEQGLIPGQPKSICYWAVEEENFIGEFQVRPDLDHEIMESIGSIGYSVKKSEWGKGYGKEILKQGLEICKSLGMDKAILLINDDNIASSRVCELCGGVLKDKVLLSSDTEGERLVRRYWIYL